MSPDTTHDLYGFFRLSRIFQGNQVIQQPEFQVNPGDSFRLFCEFDATEDHVFGKGSDDEMCMSQLWYYPRKFILWGRFKWACPYDIPLPGCIGKYQEPLSLASEEELGRIFGQSPDGMCGVTDEPTNFEEVGNVASGFFLFEWMQFMWLLLMRFFGIKIIDLA